MPSSDDLVRRDRAHLWHPYTQERTAPDPVPVPEVHIGSEETRVARSILDGLGITGGRKLVILHPGSGGSARDWNWSNFGELARRLAEDGEIAVLITGGSGEEDLVGKVRSLCGAGVSTLVNAGSILEYAALTKFASLFIANG